VAQALTSEIDDALELAQGYRSQTPF